MQMSFEHLFMSLSILKHITAVSPYAVDSNALCTKRMKIAVRLFENS